MPAVVIVGAQWGDEGKGKATDLLGGRADYVVRYQGGNNAGHTVVIGDAKFALHLLPSGILSPTCVPVIGNGVVVDLEVLFGEMDGLIARGVDPSRLVISANAHIITPYNVTLDKVTERFLGKAKIGTTGRGIGPTYGDKMARVGVRIQDLMDPSILHRKVEGALVNKNQALVKVFNRRAVEVDQTVEYLLSYADRLRPHVVDTGLLLNDALDRGDTVVLEGGQGTLLDVDHGTYPYVTSSNPTAGGACTGSGIGPTRIDRVLGILKAYTTRVGEGPFPTELFDADGEKLRTIGGEVGVTTGRNRRCGWFDAPIARYATRVNGMTDYFLTKLDVLSTSRRSRCASATTWTGRAVDEVPTTQTEFHHATPIYEVLPGWGADISGVRAFADLPANCRTYVQFLEEASGCRVSAIGVGPDRDATLVLNDLLN